MKRLLVSGARSVHTYNFIDLVKDSFEEVWLVTDQKNNERPDINQFVIEASLRNPFSFFKDSKKIHRFFADKRPDIIHIQQIGTIGYSLSRAFRKTGIPVVTTAWGSDLLLVPQMGWMYKKMVRTVLEFSDAFTADAAFVGSKIPEYEEGKGKPVVTVNFGIELIDVDFAEKEKLVYSNRLHKKLYNIDQVLRMFAEFVKTEAGKDFRLLIGGTGEETENLHKLAEELGIASSTEFAGWLKPDQNRSNYRKASIFVSVPSSDGTSISLLEALSAGCVPVVSDLPANREWVTDGENGIIVKQTRNALRDAVTLLDESVFIKNRKLASDKASKKSNQEKFLSIYNNLLNGR